MASHSRIAVVVSLGLAAAGCTGQAPSGSGQPVGSTVAVVDIEAVRPQVEHFCGNCHKTPLPESFPKDRWQDEVARGYEFYVLSGRTDLTLPNQSDITAYYRQLAPPSLVVPPPPELSSQMAGAARFRRTSTAWPGASPASLAISHILLPASGELAGLELICSDMAVGALSWISLNATEARTLRKNPAGFPSHVTRTDLDADGQPDYLVADLGSYLPEDHDRGRVRWLREAATGTSSALVESTVLSGVGRVADMQTADFDADGDTDIVVAVFGWHATGSVLLLVRDGEKGGQPHFAVQSVDSRTGAIHVPVADLNGDGHPDFVALFSQEHESVEAFLNRGDGTFQRQVLFQVPDPSYGSTGIALVDLDADRDLDVLYTNGDSFDSFYVKPQHSIRWIENRGPSWQDQVLCRLPGVHAARAADLDGDGDLDVAACCFIPPDTIARQPELTRIASLIWLEQSGGKFVRHDLEHDNAVHATLELADVNRDGAIDIVAGNFGHSPDDRAWPLDVWLNRPPSER